LSAGSRAWSTRKVRRAHDQVVHPQLLVITRPVAPRAAHNVEVVKATLDLRATPTVPPSPGLVRSFFPGPPPRVDPVPADTNVIAVRSQVRHPLPALPPATAAKLARCPQCGGEWNVVATVGPLACASCGAPAPARRATQRRGHLSTGITPAGDWSSILRPRRPLGLACGHVVGATARPGELVVCTPCGDVARMVAVDLTEAERGDATATLVRWEDSEVLRSVYTQTGPAPPPAKRRPSGASQWSDWPGPRRGVLALLAGRQG
jgi:hypothetical protein